MSHLHVRYGLIACLMAGFVIPLVVGELARGGLATVLAVLGWLCFVIQPIAYPLLSLSVGYIDHGGHAAYRTRQPARFWIGLVTMEVLLCFFALLATMALRMYLNPHSP